MSVLPPERERTIDNPPQLTALLPFLHPLHHHTPQVSLDKLSVKYVGPAAHENDAGSIQSNFPVPKERLLYYFECKITESGRIQQPTSTSTAAPSPPPIVSIGFVTPAFKHGRLPGDTGGSYAYRSNTGRKYDGHGGVTASRGELYGSQFTTGDVVGAGIWLSKQEIFFTKNGEMLGTAFKSIGNLTLFPAVGIHTPGAKVEINFGGEGGGEEDEEEMDIGTQDASATGDRKKKKGPFMFDVNAAVDEARKHVLKDISTIDIPIKDVHCLVRNYLLLYGYSKSLAMFDKDVTCPGSAASKRLHPDDTTAAASNYDDIQSAAQASSASGSAALEREHHQHIRTDLKTEAGYSSRVERAAVLTLKERAIVRELIMCGNTAAVLERMEKSKELKQATGADQGSGGGGDLKFPLYCQHFVELIRRGDVQQAMVFAQSELSQLTLLNESSRSRSSIASGSGDNNNNTNLGPSSSSSSPLSRQAMLTETVGLLAYEHPETSPLAYLLSSAHTEQVADAINAVIIESAVHTLKRDLLQKQKKMNDRSGSGSGGGVKDKQPKEEGEELDEDDHAPPPQPSSSSSSLFTPSVPVKSTLEKLLTQLIVAQHAIHEEIQGGMGEVFKLHHHLPPLYIADPNNGNNDDDEEEGDPFGEDIDPFGEEVDPFEGEEEEIDPLDGDGDDDDDPMDGGVDVLEGEDGMMAGEGDDGRDDEEEEGREEEVAAMDTAEQ
jgi:hypothetical protein